MTTAATLPSNLPTRAEEDWRYSDVEALAEVPGFADWREFTVAAGETRQEIAGFFGGRNVVSAVDRLRVHVGEGGRFALFAIANADRYARMEVEVHLAKAAHFEFGGVTLGGGQTTQEFVTRVLHNTPEATSNQTVRAVHWGQGTGNFIGRIEVGRDGQKTDAAQNFKAILLDQGASAHARPELEIFADDVKCAHGAAIGALDEKAGFYMAARGLPPEVARKLLVRAFIADAFIGLDNEALRENLLDSALSVLDARVA